jgi:hypothetical protein
MDRSGDSWTGDQVDADAHGAGGPIDGSDNRADNRSSTTEAAPRRRSVETAASESVKLGDDGAAPVTSAGGGATGESD